MQNPNITQDSAHNHEADVHLQAERKASLPYVAYALGKTIETKSESGILLNLIAKRQRRASISQRRESITGKIDTFYTQSLEKEAILTPPLKPAQKPAQTADLHNL